MSKPITTRRRLSLGSNMQSRMDMWKEACSRQQQVIAFQLFFETQAPSLEQLKQIANTLGTKLERLRGLPKDIPGDPKEGRIFQDVADWEAALDIFAQDVPLDKDTVEEARLFLEQIKLKDMDPIQDGVQVPLWRIYRVGSKSIVLTFDHVLGDGLSLMSILALVATKTDGTPLKLEETSPVIAAMCKATPWQRFVSRWKFLWLPNLIQCFRIVGEMMFFPANPITPLMPTDMDKAIETKILPRIPANYYGTIYLCPLPVKFFKTLARANEKNLVTCTDIMMTAVADAVRRYFLKVGYQGEEPIQFMTPLRAIKDPSTYLNEQLGLTNQYCPIGHTLPLLGKAAKPTPFQSLLQLFYAKTQRIKASGVVSFFVSIIQVMGLLAKPSDMAKESKNGVGKATFVWSNVPGPNIPICLGGQLVSEFQCFVSHPFCMMTTVSYNGNVYTTIQVDVRTTKESYKLTDAYVESLQAAIEELIVPEGPEKEYARSTLEDAATNHKPGPFLSRVEV